MTESLVTESLVTEYLVTESLVTESLVTESLVTESLITESLVTESLLTESLVTESLVTESFTTESQQSPLQLNPHASKVENSAQVLSGLFNFVPGLDVCNIETRTQCYKTFYGLNFRKLVIKWNVCPWQAFPAWGNICE